MTEQDFLAGRFEAQRTQLRRVAYRLLGSLNEADDAVQESWLRVSRGGVSSVENLGAWLTTIVTRVCLDMLRARKRRIEEPLESVDHEDEQSGDDALDPHRVLQIADSVGLALQVVFDKLSPGERVAYVLHDIFGLSFDTIAGMLARTPEAARQIASRARRRVQNGGELPIGDKARQRQLVEGFLVASRTGDFEALIAVLDPDVAVRADETATSTMVAIRGARQVAEGALSPLANAAANRLVLVNGVAGLAKVIDGQLVAVVEFLIGDDGILEIDIVRDPQSICGLALADTDAADFRP